MNSASEKVTQNNKQTQAKDANLNVNAQSKPNGVGLGRVLKATYCSMLGFKAAFKHEAAFRQEFLLFVLLLPVAWFITFTVYDFVALIIPMLLVLIVELINSAIEAVVDRISLERHELSGRAKDLGSAAVTVSLIIAGLVWMIYLIKYFQV